jgi:Leucine-rich repeat (LRR) protein
MSDAPRFKTFRDLKELPTTKLNNSNSSTSATSIPSTTNKSRDTSISSITSSPSNTRTSEKENKKSLTIVHSEVSPIRDFQKVPNSVTREALSQGYFKGKSKQVWDYLWSVSRGAIQPTRFIRKSRKEIKAGAGLGSMVTVDAAIDHLEKCGLIKVQRAVGSLIGNHYEIFTPEETQMTNTSITSITSDTSPIQKLDNLEILEISSSSITQLTDNKTTYDVVNTSLKTNTKSDDEAFTGLTEVFAKACEKISGKSPNKNQQRKWTELAELLVMELEVASARTTSVSDVPAFLTEHLRRRLMPAKKEAAKKEVSKTKTSKSLQIGKQQSSEPIENYQAEPLTEQGRESTKQAFAGYMEKGQKEFLLGLEDSYTREDWEWLMKELKIA